MTQQWTRDDLPRIGTPNPAHDPVVEGTLDTVVHWLNKHHPKPGVQWCANKDEVDTALRAELMAACGKRDRLQVLLETAHRDRDEAQRTLRVQKLVEEDDPLIYRIRESNVRGVNVTRDENGHWQTGGRGYANGATADGMRNMARIFLEDATGCEAVARAIEAEQAVDPVEELAGQIETAAREAIRKVCVLTGAVAPGLDDGVVEEMLDITSESRRLAAHVLGQEADDE